MYSAMGCSRFQHYLNFTGEGIELRRLRYMHKGTELIYQSKVTDAVDLGGDLGLDLSQGLSKRF